MNVLCTCILTVLLTCRLYAQDRPVQMIPQTPTAYSLGKYGDIPVSLYTGVPNISVPVYTMKNHDVSVDVSLSYHGAGIKVDEIASFVGLGWSLNAGGVITRVVRGKPETLLSDGSLFPRRSEIEFYDYRQHPSKSDFIDQNKLYLAATGQLDSEPDLFYFNFMGRTGKFVFDKNGHAVLESKEGLDIKWQYVNGYELQKFIVTDEKGTVFEFADYEATFYPQEGISRISAWYLNRISSPAGNVIDFEYHNATTNNLLTRSYTTSFVDVLAYKTSITPPVNIPYEGTGFSELRLHKIKSEAGEIEFIYKAERRKDYAVLPVTNPASSALDEIRIYKADAGLLKKFKLSTSYFQSNDVEKYDGLDPNIYSYLNYRLRLDSVQEYASDNVSYLPPYTFTYLGDNNPSTDDPYTLPYRLSPSQDHWGFYNQAYNTHMIPGLSAARNISIPAWFKQFSPPDGPESIFTAISGGANRNADLEAVKAGLLSEMHYPTGGYTAFKFEANDFAKNIPGVRIGKMIHYPVEGTPNETDYTYQGYSQYNPKDFYFEAFQVRYFYGTINPRASTLQQFGVPVDQVYGAETKKYIKITVQPQAILGHGSEVGYNTVTVSEPGKGSVISVFTGQDLCPDYIDRDYMGEYSISALNSLDKLFVSEYIDDMDAPGAPSGSVNTKTLGSQEWPYPEIYSNAWKRGVLTDRYTRSADNVTLKEEHFDYYHQLLQTVPAYKVIRLQNLSDEYVYSRYYIPETWLKLKSVEAKNYDQRGEHSVTSTSLYYYDNMAHMQPTRIETSRSDGKTEVMDLTYPLDYPTGTQFIDDMKTLHLLSYPIEQVKYLNDGTDSRIVSGLITRYKNGGKGFKDEELQLETSSPVLRTNFSFSNRPAGWTTAQDGYSKFSPDHLYTSHLAYIDYDAKGNLTEFAPDHNISTSYIWSYNFRYPVAEVKNASASECYYTGFEETGTGGASHTGAHYYAGDYRVTWLPPNNRIYTISYWYRLAGVWLYSGTLPYSNPMTLSAGDAIDDIRICPADARMTTYTYEPSVGMTSQTDIRSNTTYYEYDTFGRLYIVRDNDRNIIRKLCYGYAGQPESCLVGATVFWNKAVSGLFRKEDCPAGYVPKPVSYYVPEHTFSSVISQQNADAQAEEDMAVNGQAYANNIGLCLPAITCANCIGTSRKCINNVCETGIKIYTSSDQIGVTRYACKYYYQWSDGSRSEIFIEYSTQPCTIK